MIRVIHLVVFEGVFFNHGCHKCHGFLKVLLINGVF